jgi:hypothetical protein
LLFFGFAQKYYHKTKEGCRTTDAEIITTALVSILN